MKTLTLISIFLMNFAAAIAGDDSALCLKLSDRDHLSKLGTNCTMIGVLKQDFDLNFGRTCFTGYEKICLFRVLPSGQVDKATIQALPMGSFYSLAYIKDLTEQTPVGKIPKGTVFKFKYRSYNGSYYDYSTLVTTTPGMSEKEFQLFEFVRKNDTRQIPDPEMPDMSIGAVKAQFSDLFEFEIQ